MPTTPSIILTFFQRAIADLHAEDDRAGQPPGVGIAAQLRVATDWAEDRIGLIPHAGETEWATERHAVPGTGVTLRIATKEGSRP